MPENNSRPLTAIVAASDNRVIGANNTLLWSLPKDMRRFKQLTMGRPLFMGRNTFFSLPEAVRPLPDRENNVLSHLAPNDPELLSYADRIRVYGESETALTDIYSRNGGSEIIVMGGAMLYAATLPLLTDIHLTTVHRSFEGDAYFPPIERSQWEVVSSDSYEDIDRISTLTLPCTYEHLRRKDIRS